MEVILCTVKIVRNTGKNALVLEMRVRIKKLPLNITADQELLKEIYEDLKLRTYANGTVDISEPIWDKLRKRVNSMQ